MSKFKVGDKVVCVDNDDTGCHLFVGREYEVINCDNSSLALKGVQLNWFPGRFELSKPKVFAEGFDANGNVFNITEADLKPMMRAETRSEGFWIVVEHQGSLVFVKQGEFFNADILFQPPLPEELDEVDRDFEVINLYNAPSYACDMLSPEIYDHLVWKRKEALSPKEKALAELQASMKDLQGKIDALEKEI
jgi:hypothetical protein